MSAARREVGCSASMPPSRQPAFCAVRRSAAYAGGGAAEMKHNVPDIARRCASGAYRVDAWMR